MGIYTEMFLDWEKQRRKDSNVEKPEKVLNYSFEYSKTTYSWPQEAIQCKSTSWR